MVMRPGRLYVNTLVRLEANFRNDEGTDVDPTTVAIRVLSPSKVETTYTYGTDAEVTKSSVGDYAADITPDESGRWHFRWQTTGSGTTLAFEGDFIVQASPFYDDLTDYA